MGAPGFLAIVNPAAGGGRCGRQCQAALRRLEDAGLEVDVEETTSAGEASDIARDAYKGGRRRFIAVGGDGTSYEVINGLFPEADGADGDARPMLGMLPLGTGNSFLRDFTDRGAEHSLRAIIEGTQRACDVLRLTHEDGVLHYINLLSIGFVADVNGLRARRYKHWGQLGYVAAVVGEVFGLSPRPFGVRVDGGQADGQPLAFASFNNSKFTGGKMMMAPNADTADGFIDYVRCGALGRFSLLRTFPKIFSGTHVQHEAVSERSVSSIEFELDEEIDVMVDGEALRLVPRRIDVLPGALRIMA